jgi:flagellum-specific peptidoglycan hydrolase FlgJ
MKTIYLSIILVILCSFNSAPLSKRGQILSKIQNKKAALFVNSSWDIAQFIENVYGIPLELTIAQACQESGFGTSRKALQQCNYFGIKGYKFASKEECFLKYADILTCLPCYQNLQPKTIEQWFDALDCCYYSGDKHYKTRLKKIIEKYLTL